MNALLVVMGNGAWAFGLLAIGASILLAAFGVHIVLTLARRRDATEGRIPPLRPGDTVPAYRILADESDELLLRTPGLAALIHTTPDASSAKITEPEREDTLLVRTTGDAAVFHEPSDRRPLRIEETVSSALREGDLVLTEAGQLIPRDGEIVEGVAIIDESAVSGISGSGLCEAGGCSGVLASTLVLSGRIVIRVTDGAARRS